MTDQYPCECDEGGNVPHPQHRQVRSPIGLRTVAPVADSVTRWNALHDEFPEARYTYSELFFYGALRDVDDVLRSPTLDGLRERLLSRERPARPWG